MCKTICANKQLMKPGGIQCLPSGNMKHLKTLKYDDVQLGKKEDNVSITLFMESFIYFNQSYERTF